MAYNPQSEVEPRKIKPKANPMPQAGGAVSKSGPVKPGQPKPKTGGGLQSPPRLRAKPMPGQGGGLNARSRINDLPGLGTMDREKLVRAANRGAGSLRDAVAGQPYERDVMQAFAGDQGAAQNKLGGARPASGVAADAPAQTPPIVNMPGAAGSDTAVPNTGTQTPPIMAQPSSGGGAIGGGGGVGPVALPPPGQGQPGQGVPQGQPPGAPGAPAQPAPQYQDLSRQFFQNPNIPDALKSQFAQEVMATPNTGGQRLALLQRYMSGGGAGGTQTPPINPQGAPGAPGQPVDKAQAQSGHTSQEWGQLNRRLAGVDPALVAQWRQQMEQIPSGGGRRFDFLNQMLDQQGGGAGGQGGGGQTPPINPLPGGTGGGGVPGQTPPIYIPPPIPEQPEIFNPPIFF